MPTLREARKAKRYTAKEMADQIGISERMYYYFETHQGNLRIDKAKVLCDFLGYSLEDIFLPDDVK